tara:strand:- start:621 stop:791 length:171 start_codon:yes stop_codon:yes gene_type:complete
MTEILPLTYQYRAKKVTEVIQTKEDYFYSRFLKKQVILGLIYKIYLRYFVANTFSN